MENNQHEWFRDAFAKPDGKIISVCLASISSVVKISLISPPKESVDIIEILISCLYIYIIINVSFILGKYLS